MAFRATRSLHNAGGAGWTIVYSICILTATHAEQTEIGFNL
jgi:hypothetical protein